MGNINTVWFDYVLSCLVENLQLYWCYSFSTSVIWTPVDVPDCALWYCFDSFLRDFRDFVSWTKQMQNLIVLVLLIFCNLGWSSHTCLRNPQKIFIRIIVILSVFSRGCCFYILSYKTFPTDTSAHCLLLLQDLTDTWACSQPVFGKLSQQNLALNSILQALQQNINWNKQIIKRKDVKCNTQFCWQTNV